MCFHLQYAEAELQKNSEVDCEKMDESDQLLSEILKTSVHLNDESTVKKGKQTFDLFLLGLLYLAVYSFVVSDDE